MNTAPWNWSLTLNWTVHFYDSNHKKLYGAAILFGTEPNTDYNILKCLYIEKHILDRTASIEFFSSTGQPVTHP